MIVDFQHHYTPPELMEQGTDIGALRLDENGNPNYRFNPLLADLPAHVRMMDRAGIDIAVLSCGTGFDQPDLATCRLINDRLHQAERDHPGRFIGLAHVPALNPQATAAELKRCAIDLGFPGAVVASEIQGQQLDAECLRPFWKAAANLGLYVFVHPLPRVISWNAMDADDLGRMLGWEFSLMVATVRIINSGLLDELPTLKLQFSHFAGGLARYLPRIRGLQQREKAGTASIPRHGWQPREAFENYLRHRLFYDCADGQGAVTLPSTGASGCASVSQSCRPRKLFSRPITRRGWTTTTMWPLMSRPFGRSGARRRPFSTATMPRSSLRTCVSVGRYATPNLSCDVIAPLETSILVRSTGCLQTAHVVFCGGMSPEVALSQHNELAARLPLSAEGRLCSGHHYNDRVRPKPGMGRIEIPQRSSTEVCYSFRSSTGGIGQ